MVASVTVCIPTYNRADYLREAIESVLNQTYQNTQILVCDNASTDDTQKVVAGFDHRCVRYFRQPYNVGIAANHKSCADLADTEFIGFLSDDDLYQPDHIQFSMDVLQAYPQAAYVTCPLQIFGEGDRSVWMPAGLINVMQPLTYYEPQRAVEFLAVENPGFLNTIVCRKTALKSAIFWGKPGYVHTDVLAMTQLMVRGGFVFSNVSRVAYRKHATNISRGNKTLKESMRLKCMYWYAVCFLAKFVLANTTATMEDVVRHGLALTQPDQVVSLVMGLSSFRAPPPMSEGAYQIFKQRVDVDQYSSRFRMARKAGFYLLPLSEWMSQLRSGWRP